MPPIEQPSVSARPPSVTPTAIPRVRVRGRCRLLADMNAAIRRQVAVLRRAVCGTLTAALFLGASCAVAVAAAPVEGEPADTEPYAVGGAWQAHLPHVYGGWPAGPPESWAQPVTGYRVSAPYGIPGDWAAGRHTGIDLAVPVGTPVRSVGAGTVVFSGYAGDYGHTVMVRMRDGKYTLFAHLSRRYAAEGDRVRAGTVLGLSGNSGRSTGPHLHFEVREKRAYGTDIDPVAYLARHGVRIA